VATQVVATRYELLDKIGVGGAAVVYKARDTRLDRIVALKVLREELADDPEFVERFKREARIAAGLSHPNVVGVHDFGEYGQTAFLAMDYVDGETLKQRLQREGRLPPTEAVGVASQVLAGLAAAHARGLVHRDVKPQNVLLTSDGMARLTDFGIAGGGGVSGLTQAGTTVGTALYMSPEQVRGDPLGPPADVYSAGALLYELLTGQPPFVGRTPVEVSYKHLNDEVVPPSAVAPDVPLELEAVVMRALEKEPSARFASADAMLGALNLDLDPLGSAGLQHTARLPRATALERDRAAEAALAAAAGDGFARDAAAAAGTEGPRGTQDWGQPSRSARGAYGAATRARWGVGSSTAAPTRPWLRRALPLGVVAALAVGGVALAASGGLPRPRSSGQPVLAGASASSAEAATTRPGAAGGAATPFTLTESAVSTVGSVELAPATGSSSATAPLGSPSAAATAAPPTSAASAPGAGAASASPTQVGTAQGQPAPSQQAPGTAQSASGQPTATVAQPTPVPPPASPAQPGQAPAPSATNQPATAAPAPAPAAPPQPAQPTAAPPAATSALGPSQPTAAPSAQPAAPQPTVAPAQPQPSATGAPAKPTAAPSPSAAQPTAAPTAPTPAPQPTGTAAQPTASGQPTAASQTTAQPAPQPTATSAQPTAAAQPTATRAGVGAAPSATPIPSLKPIPG
jgi:serine/threonine-protein kinase